VVGDELEATHQFVSPAKYLAAARRISRSVVSLVFSAAPVSSQPMRWVPPRWSVTAPVLRCSAAHRPKGEHDEPSEHAQVERSGQEAQASEDPGRCGSESEHPGEHAPIAEP
jgi:hypothetical protein